MTRHDRTIEEIDDLNREIAEVAEQLAEGDIDEATAAELTDKYTARLGTLIDARSTEPDDEPAARGALTRRAKAGIGIVGVAVVAIAVFAVVSLAGDGTTGLEGVAQEVLTDGNGRDLSTISNEEMEQVVAQNPSVVPMRLALARRYFEAGEFDKALDHYFVILDNEQHPEALANVGWMTYLSGYPDVAVAYVEAALERDPTYLVAKWYLANIYVALDRGDEAIVHLVAVAEADETPTDIKDRAVELISQIESPDG
ncbi:MAG: tetratricopeptide repeat protein [Acidimicrobiia bacterium]